MSKEEKTRSKGGWLRRIGVLTLGLFIALLLLEGALRVVGFLHVRESQKRGSKAGQGTHRILCFGDSFTFGVGAASGEDYPSQLEQLLNKKKTAGKRFTVINRGVGGYNTAQVLSDLRSCVDDVAPDMVVVMVGIHNPWNLWGYNEYKKGNTFWAKAEKLLYRVRVFKLVILLAGNIRDKQQGKKNPTDPGPAPAPASHDEPQEKPEPETRGEPPKTEPVKTEPAKTEHAKADDEEHGGNGDDDEEHGGNGDDDEEHGGNGDDDEEGDDRDGEMGFGSLVDTAVVRLERFRETDASYAAVIKLLKKRKYSAAAAWLEKRLIKEPKNAVIHFSLGAIAHKRNKTAAATAWFKKGMAADPKEVDNYCGAANVYWEKRKYDDAIRWYKEAIKVAPDDPGNYSMIGRLHLDKNDQQGALTWFKKGITVGKDSANYLGLVDIFLLREQVKEAHRWLLKAVKDYPNHSELFNRLGIVHVRQKKYKEAITYFERGIAANPRDIANYEELCKALRESKIPASKSVLKKLREAARTNKVVRNYIAFLKREGGDFKAEALAWARHDLRQIQKICKERKIPFVIQSYPEPLIQLKAFAGEIGALYVDNERVFEKLFEGGEKKEKYFVPDGHCNARGYGVIANNIYKVMVQAKLFGLTQ